MIYDRAKHQRNLEEYQKKADKREKELKEIPLAVSDPASWPKGIRQIGQNELGNLGIDKNDVLYWNGKQVMIRRKLDLSAGQQAFAIVVGIFTIAGSIGAVAQGWAAAHQWGCQTKIVQTGCPTP